MPQRFKHPANLTVTTLVNRQIDDAAIAPNGDHANLCSGGAEIAEANSALQRPHVFGRQPPGDRRPVRLLYAKAWMKQPVSELAVIGKQEQPARIVVESSDRNATNTVRK